MKEIINSDSNSSNSEGESEISDFEEKMETIDTDDCDNQGQEDANNADQTSQKTKENLAWADAMAKILKINKPKRRKTIVLSRAKRANEIKTEVKEEKLDFEIEGAEEKPDVKNIPVTLSNNIDEEKEKLVKRLKKKDWASKGHVKPTVLEKDREKALQKIATRGVVQLFNAVREHQKTVEKDLEEAGPMEHKKDKVMKSLDKRAFLDVLMGPAKSQPVSDLVPKEIKEDADNPTWSILRDDFMMSSKLKDWDKEEIKDEPEVVDVL